MLSKGCLNCHTLGKGGGKIAADLTDVGSRRSADWIKRWIQDPPAMPASERGPNLWLVGPTVTVPVPGLPTAVSSGTGRNTTAVPDEQYVHAQA